MLSNKILTTIIFFAFFAQLKTVISMTLKSGESIKVILLEKSDKQSLYDLVMNKKMISILSEKEKMVFIEKLQRLIFKTDVSNYYFKFNEELSITESLCINKKLFLFYANVEVYDKNSDESFKFLGTFSILIDLFNIEVSFEEQFRYCIEQITYLD